MRVESQLTSKPWSIVLACEDGGRIQGFVQHWLRHPKPKPYCAFVGGRSLFQHTLDRAAGLSRPEQIVTLVAHEHRREAWAQLEGRSGGTVLLQPESCGTAGSIYVSLTYIRARNPQATVVIFPADHFVYPEQQFLDSVQRAVWTAEWLPDRVVFLGVFPDRLEVDYGWIIPGEQLDGSITYQIREVGSFLANPTVAQADAALAQGALWNTCVAVAKVDTLWQLGWRCFPTLMARLDRIGAAIGTPREWRLLEELHREMPVRNFCTDVLKEAPDQAVVIEMNQVLWSDWGKPEQIAHTLRQIGRKPAFPLAYLSEPFVPIAQGVSEGGVRANMLHES